MNGRFLFSELCHLAAISKEGLMSEVVHNLVLTSLVVEGVDGYILRGEIAKAVKKVFGINLNSASLDSAIDLLISKGHLHEVRGKNKVSIDKETKKSISGKITDSKGIEDCVREGFVNSVSCLIKTKSEGWEDSLWNSLQSFMSLAFMRHGVQTVSLLDCSLESSEEENGYISTFMDESISEFCPNLNSEECKEAFNLFFSSIDKIKGRYLSQLLDGTFNYYALSLDEKTLSHLKKKISKLDVYLDSNIIFGLLDLGDERDIQISKNLLKIPQQHGLPFNFLCHPETILELKRYFYSTQEWLGRQSWSQDISRAAVKVGGLGGVELKYHEINARSGTEVDIFFSQFEHLETFLGELGVMIATPSGFTAEEDLSRYEIVAQYNEYVSEKRPQSAKSYKTCDHDIVLWKTVERGIKSSKTIIDNDSVILTRDYQLFMFVRKNLGRAGVVAPIILPNNFMQLISIFTANSTDVNKGLIETFIRPVFRTLKDDYTNTRLKVISYLNTYKNVKEETAIKLLTDEILLNSLKSVERDTEEFHRKIESALIANLNDLTEQLNVAESNIESASVKLDGLSKKNEELASKSKLIEDEVAVIKKERDSEKDSYTNNTKVLISLVYALLLYIVYSHFADSLIVLLSDNVNKNGVYLGLFTEALLLGTSIWFAQYWKQLLGAAFVLFCVLVPLV